MIEKTGKILVTGRYGLVGTAIEKKLREKGYVNIIGERSRDVDLSNQAEAQRYFDAEKPQYVIHAAAKVGGVLENMKHPADFLYKNLMIQNNVLNCAHETGVSRLIFVGSSCVYPGITDQPMAESQIFSGRPDSANEGYAMAKLAGMKLCQFYNRQYGDSFITLLPCNIYGPGDRFDYETAHVVAATIRKVYEAKQSNKKSIEVWGTGKARRELMYSEDLAEACLYFMEKEELSDDVYNIGVGKDYSIRELVDAVMNVVGYDGEINWDTTKPDGSLQRLVDSTKANNEGWFCKTSLNEGLKNTFDYYINTYLCGLKN